MKLLLALVLVAFAYVVSANIDSEWEAYKTKYNKSYGTPEIEQHRKKIFIKQFEKVERHNDKFAQGLVSYELKIKENSDLNEDEKRRGEYHEYILAKAPHPIEF